MKESNNDNELDRLLNERLNGYKTEPSAETWENLNTYINKKFAKQRKRRVAWFWLLSLLLGTFSTGIYELTRNKENTSQTTQPKNLLNNTEESVGNNINHTGSKPEDNAPKEELITSDITKDEAEPTIEQSQYDQGLSRKQNTQEKLSEKESSKNSLTTLAKNKNNSLREEKNKNKINDNKNNTEQKSFTTGTITKNEVNKDNNKISEKKPLNISEDEKGEVDEQASEKETSIISANTQIEKDSIVTTVKDDESIKLSNSVLVSEDSILQSDSTIANKVSPSVSKEAEEIKATSFNKFFVAVTFSPAYANRILKDNNTGGKTAEYYNKKENPVQPTYLTEIKIGYSITNRWNVQLGVGYNSFSQKSDLISDTLGALQSSATNSSITTSTGEIDVASSYFGPYHPVHPARTRLTYRTSEKYEYLTIPLLFQYKFKDDKTSWNLLAGVSTNILIKSTMKLDINNSKTVVFNDINGLQKNNFSFVLGVGIERYLWKRVYFSLMPMLKGSFTPVNKGASVKSYPYFIGLQTGLGFKF